MSQRVLIVVALMCLMSMTMTNACLTYNQSGKRCQQCANGTRLYKGSCLYDIDHCIEYYQGLDCRKCETGFKVVRNVDRIQCKKLVSVQKEQYFEQEIDVSLQSQNPDERQLFYTFLNQYFTQKYDQNNVDSHLFKIIDRVYNNDQHDVVLFYKTSNGVEKVICAVIGKYKTFQLREIVPAASTDISEDQIVYFQPQVSALKPSKQNNQSNESKQESLLLSQTSTPQQDPTSSPTTNDQQIKQSSDFNFQYLKPQVRQKDIGYQTSNQFLKLSNNKILDDGAKVVGCFVKTSGLRKHYRLFYKTSGQEVYEGEVIYDVVRRRAYILNFGRQFSA